MSDEARLAMLKCNLEIVNTIRDEYLAQLLKAAVKELEREGIAFPDDQEECDIDLDNLVVMYGAYLYRQRVSGSDTGSVYTGTGAYSAKGMPRMLRYAINNHRFAQEMRDQS